MLNSKWIVFGGVVAVDLIKNHDTGHVTGNLFETGMLITAAACPVLFMMSMTAYV
jgi:hypothetical protein